MMLVFVVLSDRVLFPKRRTPLDYHSFRRAIRSLKLNENSWSKYVTWRKGWTVFQNLLSPCMAPSLHASPSGLQ